MCKTPCCTGSNNRSGGPAAALAVIGILTLAAAARPPAHSALTVLHAVITITVITAVTLTGIIVLAAVVLVIRRARRARLTAASHRPVTWQARPPAITPARTAMPVTIHTPLALPAAQQAQAQQAGAESDQAAFLAAVLRGLP